ncbi:MAG: proprotein convertase P-domain-containing protein [Pontiellaceae bacterium]|nr:proprotein convertase P-domain-containing protein [Pontiellaceae bacterium]
MRISINKLMWLCVAAISISARADLFTFDNINQEITDNDSRGIANVQTINGLDSSISSISISLNISAVSGDVAFNGDYYVTLQHDDKFVVLLNRVGKTSLNPFGYDDNGFNVTFTLDGADVHTYGGVLNDGTLTSSWGADGRAIDPDDVLDTDARTSTLSQLIGTNPNGDWTLFAADMNSSGKGQLNSWSIDVQAIPEPSAATFILLSGIGLLVVKRLFPKRSI